MAPETEPERREMEGPSGTSKRNGAVNIKSEGILEWDAHCGPNGRATQKIWDKHKMRSIMQKIKL